MTFGFKDTLVVFETKGGTVSRVRVDLGTGHNILTRQADTSSPR
ncbi:MAG: hypothetical protein OEW19_15500 [Acidobacteriota bacterium]|nr:hypothetical protein [Acidobacteriota bacterium]